MSTGLKTKKMKIARINFRYKGKIAVELQDGRVFLAPLACFPAIQKLNAAQRRQFTIVDDRGIFFRHSDFIYHLEDFIGLENKWRER